jgi:hypothetical protein
LSIAQGSILNATLTFLVQNAIFATSSIPEFSTHMANKYKSEWSVSFASLLSLFKQQCTDSKLVSLEKSYIRSVPYALIPYIY